MKMGVDKNGLYICSCNGKPDPRQAMNCYVIPKSDAIAPGGPVLSQAGNFPSLQFSSMPATDLDPNKAADAPTILLTNEFDGICDKLYLYRIFRNARRVIATPRTLYWSGGGETASPCF